MPLSHPIPIRLHPEQIDWLSRQTLRGLSRADALRACIWAAMDRDEPLGVTQADQHQQAQQQDAGDA